MEHRMPSTTTLRHGCGLSIKVCLCLRHYRLALPCEYLLFLLDDISLAALSRAVQLMVSLHKGMYQQDGHGLARYFDLEHETRIVYPDA
jgi:hypothetical protein